MAMISQSMKKRFHGLLCCALLAPAAADATRDHATGAEQAVIAAENVPTRLARKSKTSSRQKKKPVAKVKYRAGDTIYFNRGAKDGLLPGTEVNFTRSGKSVGSCFVGHVAGKNASCEVGTAAQSLDVQRGDRIQFAGQKIPRKSKTAASPKPSPQVMQQAKALLSTLETKPAPFTGIRQRELVGMRSKARIGARVQGWVSWDQPDQTFVRPSLDGGLRVALPFVPGFAATTAFRVQGNTVAPTNERFRPGDDPEIYVWDAALRFENPQTRWVGTLGRFRPLFVPGASLIDGVLLAYRAEGGAWEIGGYGGSVPDLVSVAPGLNQLTVGTYAKADWNFSEGLQVLPRMRLSLHAVDRLNRFRAEAETQLMVLMSRQLSLGASARLGLEASSGYPTLDAARVDLAWRPWDSLRLQAAWRHVNDALGILDVPFGTGTSGIWPSRGTHRGDFSTHWSIFDGMEIGVIGGATVDAAFGDARGYVGPELTWSRLLGDFGGVTLGHLEEPGYFNGRNSYVQAQIRPFADLLPVFWHLRANYLEHQVSTLPGRDQLGKTREVWGSTWLNAPLTPGFQMQLRAQGLYPLLELDGFGAQPTAMLLDLSIQGSL